MKNSLFAVFIVAFLIAVAITAIGLLANWGIWIQSDLVEKGQELPLLKSLVTGVILASVGLIIELGRRYLKENRDDMFIDLLAIAVVHPAKNKGQADNAYTDLITYIDEYYEPLDRNLVKKLNKAIASMMTIKYKEETSPKTISETLPESIQK